MTIVVHRDRYSTSNVIQPKRGVVIHTSESGDTSYDGIIYLMQQPGDRIIPGSDPPRKFGAAYHAVANEKTDAYTQVLPGSAGPYSASGANKDFWHIVIPGRAGQTRAEWLDPTSRDQIRGVAKFIVDKAKADGFPAHRVSARVVAGGGKGYCGHVDISNAYGLSDHWDPGPNFPWDVLAADILVYTTPSPDLEDTMKTVDPPARVLDTRTQNVPLKAGEVREVAVTLGGEAVALNLTVRPIDGKPGFLTVWPSDAVKPVTSNVNWSGKDGDVANHAIVGVYNSAVKVSATVACHLIIDLQAVWS